MITVQDAWGHLPNFKKVGRTEWSSACPECGGDDRFRMFDDGKTDNPRAWCRQCNVTMFADSDGDWRPDARTLAERRQAAAVAQMKDEQARELAIAALQNNARIAGYHEAMGEAGRALWATNGFDDLMVDYHRLGFAKDYPYTSGEGRYKSNALTIPYYAGDTLVNVQHRLLTPVNENDKYRGLPGLPTRLYRCEPGEKIAGNVVVCEGAKKAIRAYWHLGSDVRGPNTLFVAVPSKSPGSRVLSELENADNILVILDPDAYTADDTGWSPAGKMVTALRSNTGAKVAHLRLDDKIDDMIDRGELNDIRAIQKA